MEHCACGLAQLFETGREHFLLQSEIQIEREEKLVPCSLSASSIFDSQSAVQRRNLFRCVLRPSK